MAESIDVAHGRDGTDDLWNLIRRERRLRDFAVVRRCDRNDLRKGLPLMSPSLFSARLRSLEAAGVVRRTEPGKSVRYTLTEAGRELKPVVLAMGTWGRRWLRSKPDKDHLDPGLLIWDIHRTMDVQYFRAERKVLLFEFSDYTSKFRRWWLVVKDGEVDVCMKDPGFEIDLQVLTDVKTLTGIWVGDIALSRAIPTRLFRMAGTGKLKRDISKWLGTNYFAEVEPVR